MSQKIAVITGASQGLGASMARHLNLSEVAVIGTYRGGDEQTLPVSTPSMHYLQLDDVGDVAAHEPFALRLRSTLSEQFGRSDFDFLVNNAGGGLIASFEDTTEEQFDRVVADHLKGPFFLTQRLLPMIVDGGRIVNISSGLARMTTPGMIAYATAKAGVETFTRYLAKELGPRRIRVNVVAPGATNTNFNNGRVRDNADAQQQVASVTALGRAGKADDIGAAIALLLADGFGWADGARIELSGGQAL